MEIRLDLSFHLSFDYVNVIPMNKDLHRHNFVDRVDRIMQQRCYIGCPRIDSLAIYNPWGDEFSSHINHWMNCAISKGVESIDIDLSQCHISRYHPKRLFRNINLIFHF